MRCYQYNNGKISSTVINGTVPFTYKWSSGSLTSIISDFNASPGMYTLTVTDSKGCKGIASETITSPGADLLFTFTYSPITTCHSYDGKVGVSVTGGTFPYYYNWYKNETSLGVNTNKTSEIVNLPSGTYNITVTDVNLCVFKGNFTLSQPFNFVCVPTIPGITTTPGTSVTGINESTLTDNIKIYPNPSEGTFYIEANGIIFLEIYSYEGEKLKELKIESSSKLELTKKGLYIIKIIENQNTLYKKIVIH